MAKSSAQSKPKQQPTPESVQDELDRLEQERAAAIAEHLRLADQRESVLLDGTDAEIRAHDEAMAAAKVQAERAALRHERLLPELDAAEAAAEQARRQAIYAAAKAKRDDGLAAMAEYAEAAERLAKVARRISAGNFAVNEANRELPDGVEPLQAPEPYNGKPATYVEYADEFRTVAFSKTSGLALNGYSPTDPDVGYRRELTGRKEILSMPSAATPHRSFLHDLRIPSRDPSKPLF